MPPTAEHGDAFAWPRKGATQPIPTLRTRCILGTPDSLEGQDFNHDPSAKRRALDDLGRSTSTPPPSQKAGGEFGAVAAPPFERSDASAALRPSPARGAGAPGLDALLDRASCDLPAGTEAEVSSSCRGLHGRQRTRTTRTRHNTTPRMDSNRQLLQSPAVSLIPQS